MDTQDEDLTLLTADIVCAHVRNNVVAVNDLPRLISTVHETLVGLGRSSRESEVKQEPAVPVRSSVKPDYIVCLEDGRKLKTLKRHLMVDHKLTPDQYRQKWGLKPDYPMMAANYAERRRSLAKELGLGKKTGGGRKRRTPRAAPAA